MQPFLDMRIKNAYNAIRGERMYTTLKSIMLQAGLD